MEFVVSDGHDMVVINASQCECAGSGKTSMLQQLHEMLRARQRTTRVYCVVPRQRAAALYNGAGWTVRRLCGLTPQVCLNDWRSEFFDSSSCRAGRN